MTKPTTTTEAIEAASLGPKRVKIGSEEVEQFTPAELAEAANFAAASNAKSKKHFGLRFTKCIAPGGGT